MAVRREEVRDKLLQHLRYSAVDGDKAHEIYNDDAVLEFPQSGERFRGKANMQGFREQYPAEVTFEPREIRGSGDVWVAEGRVLYDDGDPVQRETIYFAEPFPAPEWRRPWAEEGATWERQDDLPARVPGGG